MLSPEEIDGYHAILKALAHPTRIAIVERLLEGEQTAGEIFSLFSFDISTVSRHLSVLKNAGLISNRREGASLIYNIATPGVASGLASAVNVLREIRTSRDKTYRR